METKAGNLCAGQCIHLDGERVKIKSVYRGNGMTQLRVENEAGQKEKHIQLDSDNQLNMSF